jgi:hypothetical protein
MKTYKLGMVGFFLVLAQLTTLLSYGVSATVFVGMDRGEDKTSSTGRKRPLRELTNSAFAYTNFQLRLRSPLLETLDAYETSQQLTNLSFGTNQAPISGGFLLRNPEPTGHFQGQFAISGNQFLSATGAVTIRFHGPQTAFGFFVTDIENANLDIVRIQMDGERVTNSVPTTNSFLGYSGGSIFFGVIDKEKPFVSVELSGPIVLNGEGYAFDNFIIGEPLLRGIPTSLSVNTYSGIQITGTVNALYQILAKADIMSTNWVVLETIIFPSSPYLYFDKTPITNGLERYYKVIPLEE